jgi:hypothetical protein
MSKSRRTLVSDICLLLLDGDWLGPASVPNVIPEKDPYQPNATIIKEAVKKPGPVPNEKLMEYPENQNDSQNEVGSSTRVDKLKGADHEPNGEKPRTSLLAGTSSSSDNTSSASRSDGCNYHISLPCATCTVVWFLGFIGVTFMVWQGYKKGR